MIMDMGSIAAAVTNLKAAGDIAKGMIQLKTTAEIQSKVIELQSVILAAQSSALAAQSDQFSLLEKSRQLESQITEMEAWKKEAERYELTDYGGGTYAYDLKPGKEQGEPPHCICAACYQKGQKSILQNKGGGKFSGRDKMHCPSCGETFMLGHYQAQDSYRTIPSGSSWSR